MASIVENLLGESLVNKDGLKFQVGIDNNDIYLLSAAIGGGILIAGIILILIFKGLS